MIRRISYLLSCSILSRGVPAFAPSVSFAVQPVVRLFAAPGVQVDSETSIRQALQDPQTTVVDARSLEEIQAAGFFRCDGKCRWVHAPASKEEAPLLEMAASSLIPDLNAPIIVYCASGIRATTSKRVLEEQGYTNVMNAGGLEDMAAFKLE